MNTIKRVLLVLSLTLSGAELFSQAASITWPLTANINPNVPVGNIQGSPQILGPGPVPAMSVFNYTGGQRLVLGTIGSYGWPAGSVDFTRYIQFDASPVSGNALTVNSVSVNYGDNPLAANFHIIKSQVYYSTDSWANQTQLTTTPLDYLNSGMTPFVASGLNVTVSGSQSFSVRIYPYSVTGSVANTASFAIHDTFVINGTTDGGEVSSVCTDFEDGTSNGWQVSNAGSSILTADGNHYLETTDQSGPSSLFNQSKPLVGDWTNLLANGCGSLCFDVNFLFPGNPFGGVFPPNTFTPYISIKGNGFSASFMITNPITTGSGWHSYCAPLAWQHSDGTLPENADGHWVMGVGTNNDWNSLLSNVTSLHFPIDPTGYQGEKFGFDNICIRNTGDCGNTAIVCDSLQASASKVSEGDCCWNLTLTHPSNTAGIKGIQFLALTPNTFVTGGSQLASGQTGWLFGANNATEFTIKRQTGDVPAGELTNFFKFCINKVSSPQYVAVNWLDASDSVLCSTLVTLDCEIPCVTVVRQAIQCDVNNNWSMQFSFINNSSFTIGAIEVDHTLPAGLTVTPGTSVISPVATGGSSGPHSFTISGALPNTTVQLWFTFISADGCCSCTSLVEVDIPNCLCSQVDASLKSDPDNCCSTLSIVNTYSGTYFTNVHLTALTSGVTFSNWTTNTSTGWYSQNTFSSNTVELVNIGNGFIPSGSSADILDFCLAGITTSPQQILVEWIRNDSVECRDTLTTECTTPPTPAFCVQLVDETMECLRDGTIRYKFKVRNNSTYSTTGFQLNPLSPSSAAFSPSEFNSVPIGPGMTSAEQTVIISGTYGSVELCYEIALFMHIYENEKLQYSWCCHSEQVCITIPDCGRVDDCVEPPKEMVAWWPFDETSVTREGSVSNDLAGFNNLGVRTNGPVPVAGVVLGALEFDGKDDYVQVPHHAELSFGIGNFSFDAWIWTKMDEGVQNLVDKRISSVGYTGYSFFLNKGRLSLQMSTGSVTNYDSPLLVADGKWHHIAVTVDRRQKDGITFYLDGVPTQYGDPTPHAASLDNTGPLRIGSLSYGNGYLFTGVLDEIELFNRVITKDEINSIFEAGKAGKCKSKTSGTGNDLTGAQQGQITVYPNPASTRLFVEFENSGNQSAVLKIHSILGAELVNKKITGSTAEIDVSDLPGGFYIVSMTIGQLQSVRKTLIIER